MERVKVCFQKPRWRCEKNDGKPQRRWDGGDNVASHLFRAYTPKREQRDFDKPNFNYFRLLVQPRSLKNSSTFPFLLSKVMRTVEQDIHRHLCAGPITGCFFGGWINRKTVFPLTCSTHSWLLFTLLSLIELGSETLVNIDFPLIFHVLFFWDQRFITRGAKADCGSYFIATYIEKQTTWRLREEGIKVRNFFLHSEK